MMEDNSLKIQNSEQYFEINFIKNGNQYIVKLPTTDDLLEKPVFLYKKSGSTDAVDMPKEDFKEFKEYLKLNNSYQAQGLSKNIEKLYSLSQKKGELSSKNKKLIDNVILMMTSVNEKHFKIQKSKRVADRLYAVNPIDSEEVLEGYFNSELVGYLNLFSSTIIATFGIFSVIYSFLLPTGSIILKLLALVFLTSDVAAKVSWSFNPPRQGKYRTEYDSFNKVRFYLKSFIAAPLVSTFVMLATAISNVVPAIASIKDSNVSKKLKLLEAKYGDEFSKLKELKNKKSVVITSDGKIIVPDTPNKEIVEVKKVSPEENEKGLEAVASNQLNNNRIVDEPQIEASEKENDNDEVVKRR